MSIDVNILVILRSLRTRVYISFIGYLVLIPLSTVFFFISYYYTLRSFIICHTSRPATLKIYYYFIGSDCISSTYHHLYLSISWLLLPFRISVPSSIIAELPFLDMYIYIPYGLILPRASIFIHNSSSSAPISQPTPLLSACRACA